MSTFTIELKPAPELTALVERLLSVIAPKSAAAPGAPFQTPEELAARARMNPPSAVPAPMPRLAPTFDPRNPRPQSVSQIYPQMPASPAPGYPANPQMPAPIVGLPGIGAGNTVPAAGPAPLRPAPIVPSTNPPLTAGPSTSQPAGYPSNPAPTATAPTYAQDDLARATATLADAGKIDLINQLFQQFQIQRMDQLPKERYGEYATALRGLGARI